MEERKAFEQLIDKYLAGQATSEEKRFLEFYYESLSGEGDVLDTMDPARKAQIKHQLRQRVLAATKKWPRYGRRMTRRWYYWAGAAAILLAAAIFFTRVPGILTGNNSIAQTFRAGDTVRQLHLPDGTIAYLNKGAVLHLLKTFGKKDRRVSVEGEIYFNVSKDAMRPFVAETGRLRVDVLGTAFCINTGAEQETVTLASGGVKVHSKLDNGATVTLSPGKQVSTVNGDNHLRVSPANLAGLLAWKPTAFQIKNATMREIAAFMQERYACRLVFKNPRLANCHITTSLGEEESLESILKVMARVNNFSYHIQGNLAELDGEGCASDFNTPKE